MNAERNLRKDLAGKEKQAFNIEAALNEEGPQTLIIIPSDDEYLVYNTDETFIASIKHDEDREWDVTEGEITEGIANIIGKEISRS
jgi:hypothetical protein